MFLLAWVWLCKVYEAHNTSKVEVIQLYVSLCTQEWHNWEWSFGMIVYAGEEEMQTIAGTYAHHIGGGKQH